MTDISAAGMIKLGDLESPRFGFGTMRLTGPRIWGPPADRDAAVAVLQEAVDSGVRVIDTAWYYGPDVADELVAEALSPYPDHLVIITKHGGARTGDGGWKPYLTPEQLRDGVERDLKLLRLDAIPVTHLRWMDHDGGSFDESLDGLLALVEEGKVQRIGLSNVTTQQLDLALAKTEIVSVSNDFSVLRQGDAEFVERCERDGIAFLPFFPLGASPTSSGMGVRDSEPVKTVAEKHNVGAAAVAIAWLLHRSPALLPIPGTSSVDHLRDNLAAASLSLDHDDMQTLAKAG